jgi:hypothetical protein
MAMHNERWSRDEKRLFLLLACMTVAYPALSAALWHFGYREYAVAVICMLAAGLVCAAIGIWRDRRFPSRWGRDSQQWREAENWARKLGKICGVVASCLGLLLASMVAVGLSPKTVILIGVVAFAMGMVFLALVAGYLRRR